MVRWRRMIGVLGIALVGGCAAPAGRQAMRVEKDVDWVSAEPPGSVLLGGAGLDGLALQLGRADWPSSDRDHFNGEQAAYHEVFYDVQGTPWSGNPSAGGFLWRQFRSDRTGGFSR